MSLGDFMTTVGARRGLRTQLRRELAANGIELTREEWDRVDAAIRGVRARVRAGAGTVVASGVRVPVEITSGGLDKVAAVVRDILQAREAC